MTLSAMLAEPVSVGNSSFQRAATSRWLIPCANRKPTRILTCSSRAMRVAICAHVCPWARRLSLSAARRARRLRYLVATSVFPPGRHELALAMLRRLLQAALDQARPPATSHRARVSIHIPKLPRTPGSSCSSRAANPLVMEGITNRCDLRHCRLLTGPLPILHIGRMPLQHPHRRERALHDSASAGHGSVGLRRLVAGATGPHQNRRTEYRTP